MSIETQEYSTVEVSSSRSFGIVFAVVFAIIGLYPLLGDGDIRLWSLAVAGGFAGVALVFPRLLQPLNLLWFRFGILLGRVINPLVMLVIYVVTMVPIGLAMRLAGKDMLNLKLDSKRPSYWIDRAPPGPEPQSLEDQF